MSSSVLFVVTQRIGDALSTTPAISAIARDFGPVTVLCKPELKPLFENNPDIYRVIPHTTRSVRIASITRWLKKYELAVCFTENRAFTRYALALSSRVIAFSPSHRKNEMRGVQYTSRPHWSEAHLIDEALALIAGVSTLPRCPRMTWAISELEKKAARKTLDSLGDHRGVISVKLRSHPDRPYRDWPIDYFQSLFERLDVALNGFAILLLGPREEAEFIDRVISGSAATRLYRIPAMNLREVAALIAESDLYLGVDTGLTQIASCFDKPLIGLYHCAITQRRAGPLNHPHNYSIDMPTNDGVCCREVGSMRAITVSMVEDAIIGALRASELVD